MWGGAAGGSGGFAEQAEDGSAFFAAQDLQRDHDSMLLPRQGLRQKSGARRDGCAVVVTFISEKQIVVLQVVAGVRGGLGLWRG